jgi:hypothetical protein
MDDPGSESANLRVVLDERDKRYEQRFTSIESATALALSAAKELTKAALDAANAAVTKAEAANEKRLENVNEFRDTLSDQQRTLLPRTEADARLAAISEKVEALQRSQERVSGQTEGGRTTKDDSRATWAVFIAVGAHRLAILSGSPGSSEATGRPRDKHGVLLKEGDAVYIPARIRRIPPEHDFYNLIVQFDDDVLVVQKNPSFTVNVSHLNARAVRKSPPN